MTKKLVVPALLVGLALFNGCGSDSKSSSTGGSGGASTGGSGGASTGGSGGASTGGSGGATGGSGGATGGSGGATGGSGGATGGAGGGTGGAKDGGATDGGGTDTGTAAVDWTMCPANGSLPGVSAMEFCMQYDKACMFAAGGGTAGMERFKTMGDCVTGYNALPTTNPMKGAACAAYHLCVASKAGMAGTHCPHPVQATLMPASGPCAP